MADKYDKQSTARLPIMESVIIIAIFSIVSVVIMQMYISANRLQKKAVNISKATILAENTAEEIRRGEAQAGTTRYFDPEWKETSSDGRFILSSTVSDETTGPAGKFTTVTVTVKDRSREELISIDTGYADYGG